MTGHDFLSLAQTLVTGRAEVEWRSAASRAYYAAFHTVRDLFRALGFAVPRADVAHKYLAHRLQNRGHPHLQQAGLDLENLRTLRNEADYDLSPSFSQRQGRSAIDTALRIIQALSVTAVEPTRTQVRDGIIAYERNVLHQVTWSPPRP